MSSYCIKFDTLFFRNLMLEWSSGYDVLPLIGSLKLYTLKVAGSTNPPSGIELPALSKYWDFFLKIFVFVKILYTQLLLYLIILSQFYYKMNFFLIIHFHYYNLHLNFFDFGQETCKLVLG